MKSVVSQTPAFELERSHVPSHFQFQLQLRNGLLSLGEKFLVMSVNPQIYQWNAFSGCRFVMYHIENRIYRSKVVRAERRLGQLGDTRTRGNIATVAV